MKSLTSKDTIKDICLIILFTLGVTFLIWLPHLLRLPNFFGLDFSEGFNTIYRNFDGLEYVMIAKTFYQPQLFAALPQSLPANYFAAHFPGYAMFILFLAPLLGFLKSMVFSALFFTTASAIAFYFLVRDFKLSEHPLFLSFVFLILPARWTIVHSVGSAEPMFIFFTIMALYFFMKYETVKNYLFIVLAAVAGLAAQFTRPPGILLFAALGFYIVWEIIRERKSLLQSIAAYLPLLLIPLSLIAIFFWYSISLGDFFAYFHSGDNVHLTFPPFQVFNINQFWVGSMWLEDIIYIFILGFAGGLALFKQKLYPLSFFVLIYLAASTFVAHRDVSRYVLPVFPFVLIAFEKVLTSKEYNIILIILVFGIYLYAQNFLLANTAPFPNPHIFN